MVPLIGRPSCRYLTASLFVTMCAWTTLGAQSRRYIAAGNSVHRIDGTAVTTLFTQNRAIYGAAMDADNRHILFSLSSSSTSLNAGLYRLDPTTSSVSTVFDNPQHIPYDISITSEGDYLFTGLYSTSSSLRPSNYGLFRYSAGSGITTVATAQALGGAPALRAGVTVDIDTGNFIVPDASTSSFGRPIWSIGLDGSITTLGTTQDNGYSVVQDIPSGDVYLGGYSNCYRLQRGSSTASSLWPQSGRGYFHAMELNEASARPRELVANYSSQQYRVALATNAVTTITLSAYPGIQYETFREERRNIQSFRTGTRTWDYFLSFPNAGGKGYAVALSVSGVRPGLPLGDGRWVQIYPDSVTVGTMSGALGFILKNATGFLDSQGRGVATLDLQNFPATAGLRVWAVAVVLDPSAPRNVGAIADPTVLVVR